MPFLSSTSGPFSVEFLAHDDAEAFDRNAGYVGACVEHADTYLALHCTAPVFHETFTPILEKMSGILRRVNEKATADAQARAKNKDKVSTILESFVTFANYAKALTLKADGGESLWADIEAEALRVSRTVKIDAAPIARERAVDKKDLEKAMQWLGLDDPDFVEAKVSKFSEFLGGFNLFRDEGGKPQADSLARLIGAYFKRKREIELMAD